MSFVNMFKVLILLCCVVGSLTVDSLCSNKKSDGKCFCTSVTDSIDFPENVADCNGLNLREIPTIKQLDQDVSEIDLSLNDISWVKESALESKILSRIILSYNKIEAVDDHAFENAAKLQELDLNNNQITSLTRIVFEPLTDLKILDLSYNNISKIPNGIFIDSNPIYVDFSYNPIGDYLMTYQSTFKDVLGSCTNLSTVKLNHIGFSNPNNNFFEGCNQIKHLSLSDNKLKFIPTLPQTIEYLDLSGNELTFVSAAYLNYGALKVLKLNRMPTLTDIHHYAFFNLKSLTELQISDCNKLEQFSDLAFGIAEHNQHVKPKSMILSRNGLKSLNSTYRYFFDRLEGVDLSENQWNCDCEILWMQQNKAQLYNARNIRCATPGNLHNRRVLLLNDTDLPECFPEKSTKKFNKIVIPILILTVVMLGLFVIYLIRYGHNWYNGNRPAGPNSPYSIAVDEA